MERESIQQRLLGMLAVEHQFITEKQYTQILNLIDFFEEEASFEEMVVKKGFMTKELLDKLKYMVEENIKPRKKHGLFGTIAVDKGYINSEELCEALQIQQRFKVAPLGQILWKKGYLSDYQIRSILDFQGKLTGELMFFYCATCGKDALFSAESLYFQQSICCECYHRAPLKKFRRREDGNDGCGIFANI